MAITLVVLAFLTSGAFAAPLDGVAAFTSQLSAAQEKSMLNAAETDKLSAIRAATDSKNVSVVSFDRASLFSTLVNVPFPDGRLVQFIKKKEYNNPSTGTYTWVGGTSAGDAVITIGPANTIVGRIQDGYTHMTIQHLAENSDRQALIVVNDAARSLHDPSLDKTGQDSAAVTQNDNAIRARNPSTGPTKILKTFTTEGVTK